jgi:serine/threonine protein kinase
VFSVVFVCSASGGELQMLLDKDEVPEERQVKRLMHQILDGLVFLHSINVAHLDIKVTHC